MSVNFELYVLVSSSWTCYFTRVSVHGWGIFIVLNVHDHDNTYKRPETGRNLSLFRKKKHDEHYEYCLSWKITDGLYAGTDFYV